MKIKKFCKLLKEARKKHGFQFTLVDSAPVWQSKRKMRYRHAIYWRSPQTSLLTPLTVVCWVEEGTTIHPKRPSRFAAQKLGISPSLYNSTYRAIMEAEGHDPKVRKKLLAACKLTEVPWADRPVHKIKKDKP